MGYSYAQEAGRAFENLLAALRGENAPKSTNCWFHNGVQYFWERGKENTDGAITGTVMRFHDCKNVGGFRIEANGTVTRFPTASMAQRKKALEHGNGRRNYLFG